MFGAKMTFSNLRLYCIASNPLSVQLLPRVFLSSCVLVVVHVCGALRAVCTCVHSSSLTVNVGRKVRLWFSLLLVTF